MSDWRSGRAWWAAEGRGDRAVLMREAGWSMSRIAAELGTTKSAVAGYLHRHHPEVTDAAPVSTIFTRLAAVHATMDAVLAATQPAIDARIAPR